MEKEKKIKGIGRLAIFALSLGVLFSFFNNEVKSEGNNGDDKITICHFPSGNLNNSSELVISINALQAHLAHGDYIGICNDEPDQCNINKVRK